MPVIGDIVVRCANPNCHTPRILGNDSVCGYCGTGKVTVLGLYIDGELIDSQWTIVISPTEQHSARQQIEEILNRHFIHEFHVTDAFGVDCWEPAGEFIFAEFLRDNAHDKEIIATLGQSLLLLNPGQATIYDGGAGGVDRYTQISKCGDCGDTGILFNGAHCGCGKSGKMRRIHRIVSPHGMCDDYCIEHELDPEVEPCR